MDNHRRLIVERGSSGQALYFCAVTCNRHEQSKKIYCSLVVKAIKPAGEKESMIAMPNLFSIM
jgi:hypothetical protein